MEYKNGVAVRVQYVALKRTTGLTDLTLKTYNPSGTLVDTTLLTEVSDGLYNVNFTPNVVGQWRIEISSVANGDAIQKAYDVVATLISDVQASVTALDAKVDVLDDKADAIDGKVTVVDGKVDAVDAKIDIIDANVDSVKSTVEASAVEVTAIKSKTDNLPANTATELSDIKTTLSAIASQINIGGYIL